jgi:pantothenate synthetase
MSDESKLTIEELLTHAGNSNFQRDTIRMEYIELAKAKMQLADIALTKRNQEISEKQLDLSNQANTLTQRLLISNEQASNQNEENARLMNEATQKLAESTKSLKWATLALVAFTAVQALIAFVALYKK